MTRINTNISSLTAQKTLSRSNADLQLALTRLSTGLRINTGKDDPAGLIASEILRSDITATNRAITNSERANQLIATADSALTQVSSLLNDIRGLVSEAANTGALSDEQIQANQLQVDSSLESIDRIARVTSFQGRRLLDGNLDFITTSPGNTLTTASVTAGGDVDANATGEVGGKIFLSATSAGAAFNANVSFVSGGALSATLSSGTLTVTLASGTGAASDVVSAINAGGAYSASLLSGVSGGTAFSTTDTGTLSGGSSSNQFTVSAVSAGSQYANATITFTSGATAGSEVATYNSATRTLNVQIADGVSTATQIVSAINADLAGVFTAGVVSGGAGALATSDTASFSGGAAIAQLANIAVDQANFGTVSAIDVNVEIDVQATRAQLRYSAGTLGSALVLEIGGSEGFEVFNFGTGTTIDSIATAINTNSDATGVQASVSGGVLELSSTDYGSKRFVTARTLNGNAGGLFETFDATGNLATRAVGTDVVARVNGIAALGDGLRVSINTASLDVSFDVSDYLTGGDSVQFSITGGGANFQLGPDVVSNQQARLGIQGVNAATLGGLSGTLFELRSGGSKALAVDATGAAKVVDEVITKLTQLRGRLGAFQRTTIETNIFTLNDTLEALTDAESSIRDADFAAESARLTRAQILVQSGTAVLAIANQNPQNVLALLR